MKLSQLLMFTGLKREAKARLVEISGGMQTTYRRKTRRHGGVMFVGIPNKIAKRLGR